MAQIDRLTTEALAWLRFVLNPDTQPPLVTDWAALYAFAQKQALLGICLPERQPENIKRPVLLQWIGETSLIEKQNKALNRQVEELFGLLESDGFRCTLLKGQGNALLYPHPLSRCPGDIDVWVDSDEETAYSYVRKKCPDADVSRKHIHFPLFADTSVDVHVTPLKLYSRRHEKALQRWIEQNREAQFAHFVRLPGGNRDICAPTSRFNAVYQLGHMMIHVLDEGLGLRQVVDYFYLLRNLTLTEGEKAELLEDLRSVGLLRFARAILWIENDVLGLPTEKCFVKPDKRGGRLLLQDILEGGNFGKNSERYSGEIGFYKTGFAEARHNVRLLSLAPHEGTARLWSKLKTAVKYAMHRSG